MPESILQIESLSKRYGKIIALDNLNLTIKQGNVYGLLGPNGSGKTTSLLLILGIIKQDYGTYKWLNDISIDDVKKEIGTLIENPIFYPYLNLKDNLKIICKIKNIPYEDIDRVIQIAGLQKRINSRYDTLSLGMKQRLALASVLLGDPKVLILDEPTNGLDPEGIAEVRTIIRNEANKGKTIILASHILDEVEKVCSHVAVLKKGKLIGNGEVRQLLNKQDVYIVSTDKLSELNFLLKKVDITSNEEIIDFDISFNINYPHTIADVNKFAHENGIILTKIEKRKHSLETHFLELVKN